MIGKRLALQIPELQFVPEVTNLLGILSGHPSYMEWMLNNYIDISINRNYEEINLEDIDRSPDCPFIEDFCVKRHFAQCIVDGFLNFLIRSIDNGYYISLRVDVFYLDCYKTAIDKPKAHFEHNLLVFGYEQDGHIIHIADFFDFSHYSMCACSSAQLENAFSNVFAFQADSPLYQYNPTLYAKTMQNINLLRLLPEKRYHCGIEQFCRNISNYLNPDYPPKASKCGRLTDGNAFNLAFYDVLAKDTEKRSDAGEALYHRPFAMLVQHKELMRKRLLYLESQYGIAVEEMTRAKMSLNQLLNQCRTMLTAVLFYNRSRRKAVAASVCCSLWEIKQSERITLEYIVQALTATR